MWRREGHTVYVHCENTCASVTPLLDPFSDDVRKIIGWRRAPPIQRLAPACGLKTLLRKLEHTPRFQRIDPTVFVRVQVV